MGIERLQHPAGFGGSACVSYGGMPSPGPGCPYGKGYTAEDMLPAPVLRNALPQPRLEPRQWHLPP